MSAVGRGVLITAAPGAHGDVSHGTAGRPVALAVLAEVTRLVEIIVVVVAELGCHAGAPRARKDRFRFRGSFLLPSVRGFHSKNWVILELEEMRFLDRISSGKLVRVKRFLPFRCRRR